MKLLPKLKHVLLLALTFLTLPLFFATSARAQVSCPAGIAQAACDAIIRLYTQGSVTPGPWYDQNPSQFASKVFGGSQDEIFGERYTFAQINWIINSIAAMLNPMSGITNAQQFLDFMIAIRGVVSKSSGGQMPTMAEFSKLGPIGMVGGGMGMLFANPPASGVQEIKYTAQRIFDVGTGVQPVYAQGFGFQGLNSGGAVHSLWTATRNMSYLIMVIMLIASGFLIMFRIKINPQTVVTLQTMIPKLIITMLLVTFSFAIAGLVVDLVYAVILAFVGMLGLSPGILSNASTTIRWLTTSGFTPQYVGVQLANMVLLIIFMTVGGFLLPGIAGVGIGNLVTGVIGAILGIILALWMFVILIKIFIMLVKSYVTLILLVCVGPLQIMMDLIPGQKGFGPWIRNVIANASVFAVVPIMLIIQHIFTWNPITGNVFGLTDFNTLGNVYLSMPFLDGGALKSTDILFRMIIGYTIFSMTPKIAEIIRDALKIPPFKYGADFGGLKVGLGYAEGWLKAKADRGGYGAVTTGVLTGAQAGAEAARKSL